MTPKFLQLRHNLVMSLYRNLSCIQIYFFNLTYHNLVLVLNKLCGCVPCKPSRDFTRPLGTSRDLKGLLHTQNATVIPTKENKVFICFYFSFFILGLCLLVVSWFQGIEVCSWRKEEGTHVNVILLSFWSKFQGSSHSNSTFTSSLFHV
jgi:hypothetical protein